MAAALFSITCTTCRARLKVREASAIGQILGCPKCGGMVQVVPPLGWQPGMTESEPVSTDSSGVLPKQVATAATVVPQPPPLAPPVIAPAQASSGGMSRLVRAPWVWGALATTTIVAVAVWFLAGSSPQESAAVPEAPALPSAETAAPPKPVENSRPPGSLFVEQVAPLWKDAVGQLHVALQAFAAAEIPSKPPKAAPPEPIEPAAVVAAVPPVEPPAVVAEPASEVRSPDSLPVVDVDARLADVVPELKYSEVKLSDFIDFVSQASTLPITFDLDAMIAAGIRPSQSISIEARGSTWADILTAAVGKANLTYNVEHGQVIVSVFPQFEAAKPTTERYDVSDLAGGEPAAVALLVRTFVEPATWSERGGAGAIQVEGQQLIVQQLPEVQGRVLRLLDKLRAARGITVKNTTAEAPTNPMRAKLATPINASFRRATTLRQLVDYLGQKADLDIYLNTAALATAGRSAQSEMRLVSHEQPLSEVLDTLLRPLGLTYRVLNERTLEITSSDAARQRVAVEFHRVGDLLSAERTPAVLVETIKAQVHPSSWKQAIGSVVIECDVPSGCLIVRQSQPVQRTIAAALEALRGKH